MAIVINTNTPALHAGHQAFEARLALEGALQRLSSGLRINTAKDDAAGLAIADRMTVRIRGLAVAARNVNDGISMLQGAEAGMAGVVELLQRMRDLSVQALNGSNSSSDRAALDAEFQQLKGEVDRISLSTSFNRRKLLDGSLDQLTFQVGAGGDEVIAVTSLVNLRTTALGMGSFAAGQSGVTLTSAGGIGGAGQFTLSVGGTTYDVYQGSAIAGDALALANAINARAVPGVTATPSTTTISGNFVAGSVTAGAATLTLNGQPITLNLTGAGATDLANTAAAIRANAGSTGVSASATAAGITLSAIDGRNITMSFSGGATGASADQIGLGDGGGSVIAPIVFGHYDLSYSGATVLPALTIGGSAGAGEKGQADAVLTPERTETQLAQVDLTSDRHATLALATIDSALAAVATARASLGAYQNRFGFAIGQIESESEALSGARSRIRDSDFAMETAVLVRAQVRQLAANAMLVQANAWPGMVLALLR